MHGQLSKSLVPPSQVLSIFRRVTFVALLGLYSFPSEASFKFLEEHNISERIDEEVAKLKIGGSVDLVDADIFDGVGIALKYRAQSEPSYTNGYYTRFDHYTLQGDIEAGQLLDGLGPFSFNVSKNAEIIFARQFKSQKDSLLAIPYTLKNIPINAKAAINNLNPGDFVGLQAQMTFIMSLNGVTPLNGVLELKGSTHALVSGNFLIHIFKLKNDKLRIKFIANKGRGVGAQASLGIIPSVLEVTGLKIVDDRIKDIIDVDVVQFGADLNNQIISVLDYVIDLKDAEAVQAYNKVMSKKMRFRTLNALNPLDRVNQLDRVVLTDLSEFEKLAIADTNKSAEQKRVDRVFKGTQNQNQFGTRLKFGISLIKFEQNASFSESKIESFDLQENRSTYLLSTFLLKDKLKLLFGLYGGETEIVSNLLFKADNNWQPQKFVGLALERNVKLKKVSQGDFEYLKEKVTEFIPQSELNRINWRSVESQFVGKVNASFRHVLFFLPEALAKMPSLKAENIENKFINYIEPFESFITKNVGVKFKDPLLSSEFSFWLDEYRKDIFEISNQLAITLNPKSLSAERYKAFASLKDIPLWQEKGIGFLLSLLPKNQAEKLISYELNIVAKNTTPLEFKFGNFAEKDIYNSIIYVQNAINNRSIDMRHGDL